MGTLDIGTILRYYKRPDIQNALVDAALDKEIGISFGGKGYGKRPDVLAYPRDVIECVKRGATSFHCSEETWENVLQIKTGMHKQEADDLRKGWDLVLDIDCPFLPYSQVCADVLVKAILHHDIPSVSVKFSGNNGFHIGIPFEAFPSTVNGEPMKKMFPDGARRIAMYLAEFIREPLKKQLLEKFEISDMAQNVGKTFEEVVKNKVFDPFEIMHIDTVLISARHLYRMPYSLHEKSGLVSLPILPEQIESFDRSMAKPEIVKPELPFFRRDKVIPGEAKKLLVQAFDFKPVVTEEKRDIKIHKQFLEPQEAIPEELFPPCIHAIFNGMEDGKKRGMFILTNFLKSAGWGHEEIEKRMLEWNKKNPEPIKEVILKGHIRHHKSTARVMPPSCSNKAYYVDLQVCKPDNLCGKIKNPFSYARRKAWALQQNAKKKRGRKKKVESKDQQDAKDNKESAPKTSSNQNKTEQTNQKQTPQSKEQNNSKQVKQNTQDNQESTNKN